MPLNAGRFGRDASGPFRPSCGQHGVATGVGLQFEAAVAARHYTPLTSLDRPCGHGPVPGVGSQLCGVVRIWVLLAQAVSNCWRAMV
jgi:hypothetical protein